MKTLSLSVLHNEKAPQRAQTALHRLYRIWNSPEMKHPQPPLITRTCRGSPSTSRVCVCVCVCVHIFNAQALMINWSCIMQWPIWCHQIHHKFTTPCVGENMGRTCSIVQVILITVMQLWFIGGYDVNGLKRKKARTKKYMYIFFQIEQFICAI